jgi:hypothetical protein
MSDADGGGVEQDLFMIDTDAVGRHVQVKEADLADQRFLSFVFAPCADYFHTRLCEQS